MSAPTPVPCNIVGGEDKFWKKVAVAADDECWLWTGSIGAGGYGVVRRGDRLLKAHRLAWHYANGPATDGMCVLHRCDVRLCCNPKHLFIGTSPENTADRDAKGRMPRGEAHGMCKISEPEVLAIRRAGELGLRHSSIAKAFNMGRSQVTRIIRGAAWKHVK